MAPSAALATPAIRVGWAGSGVDAMTRDTLMDWTADDAGERYSASQGTCQGHVWRESTGDWAARISHEAHTVDQNWFPVLDDARAWCEVRLAELAATGRCD